MAELPLNDRLSGPYIATAGQTDFPADFPLIDLAGLHARVERAGIEDMILTAPAVTATAESDSAFTARLATPALAGDRVSIFSRLPAARPRAHVANGAVRTATLEADAVAFQAQLQEHRRDLDNVGEGPGGGGSGTDPTALKKLSNLADLASASTALTNLGFSTWFRSQVGAISAAAFRAALGLGGAAVLAVGTAPGTVAAGDDPRFAEGGGGQTYVIGLKSLAGGVILADAIKLVRTSGYSTVGKGAAAYVFDPAVDAAFVAAHPRAAFLTDDGRGFRLDEVEPNNLMFGSVADGATNDGPAMQAAINWCSARKLPLTVIGPVKVNASLNIGGSLGSFKLKGNGLQFSELIFANGAGIAYACPQLAPPAGEYDYVTLMVRDIGLRTMGGVSTVPVLAGTGSGGNGGTGIGLVMENVDISGQTENDGFAYAIDVNHIRNIALTNIRILGDRANPNVQSQGIRIRTDEATSAVEANLNNCDIYFVQRAVELNGAFEGLYCDQLTVVAAREGIVSTRLAGFEDPVNGGGDPLITVVNSHFNTSDFGIRCRNRFQSIIKDTLFYGFPGPNPATVWIGVELQSDSGPNANFIVKDCIFYNFAGLAGYNGIAVSGTAGIDSVLIDGCIFDGQAPMQTGIWLQPTSNGVRVGRNIFLNTVTAILNQGTDNRVAHELIRDPASISRLMLATGPGDDVNTIEFGATLVPDIADGYFIGDATINRRIGGVFAQVLNAPVHQFGNAVSITRGAGSPEGVVTASPGSLFLRSDGGSGLTLYVKESGTGNTGWATAGGAAAGWQTVTGTSPTPALTSSQVRLAQTSPTNVISFSGLTDGQEVVLLATNGNTTLEHNGSLMILRSAVNVTLSAGQAIRLIRDGGQLREIGGRNF